MHGNERINALAGDHCRGGGCLAGAAGRHIHSGSTALPGSALFRLGGPPLVDSLFPFRAVDSCRRCLASIVIERSVCVGRSRSVRYLRVAYGASPRLPWPQAWRSRSPAASCPTRSVPAAIDIPKAYRAGPRNADAALPSVVWWRGFRSKELTDSDRGGADLQFRRRGRRRPHRPGRRAIAHRRRAAAADGRSRTAARPARAPRRAPAAAVPRAVVPSAPATARRSARATRSTSGARTARRCARPKRPRSPAASIARWWRSPPSSASPTPISRFWRRTIGCASRATTLPPPTRVFNLIKQRFDVGTASALDVAQQESVVNTQRAAIPPLEQMLAAEHRDARGADRPPARSAWPFAAAACRRLAIPPVTPGLPVRSAGAAPGHPRGRGAARLRQRQRRIRRAPRSFPASS